MRDKDFAEIETDNLIEDLEKRIAREYSLALKEIKEKYNKYIKQFEEDDKKQKQKVVNGEITEKDYKEWRMINLYNTERYNRLSDILAKDLMMADKKALSMTNGYLPEAYALNFNYSTYEIEQGVDINTNFTLYSRETVERLFKENPDLLPARKMDIPKDLLWNKQHINSCILQGVLQGDKIDSIANRLQQVTDMDRRAAVRNARTMMTGAQNSGRINAYDRASKLGIDIQKEWMATLDNRTRDSHARLDGERVDYKKAFSNGLQFPGDPNGDPSEVYNCRCTIVPFYPEYSNVTSKRMTYDEWKKRKKNDSKDLGIDHIKWMKNIYNQNYSAADLQELAQRYNSAPEEMQKLYEKYGDQLKQMSEAKSGFFKFKDKRVYLDSKKDINGGSWRFRFQTSSHEIGHNMDYLAGGNKYLSSIFRDSKGRSFKDIIYDDFNNVFSKMNFGVKVFEGYENSFNAFVLRSVKRAQQVIDIAFENASNYASEAKNVSLLKEINDLSLKYLRIYRGQKQSVSSYKEFYFNNKDFFERFSNLNKWVSIDKNVIESFIDEIKSKYSPKERGDLSDIFERYCIEHGGSSYPFGFGHGEEYALKEGNLETETFAEICDSIIASDVSLDLIKEYLPQTYEAFLEMIRSVLK